MIVRCQFHIFSSAWRVVCVFFCCVCLFSELSLRCIRCCVLLCVELWFFVCHLLFVVCRMLFVVCCVMFVVWGLLFVCACCGLVLCVDCCCPVFVVS